MASNFDWRKGSVRDASGCFVNAWSKFKDLFPPPFFTVMKWVMFDSNPPKFPSVQESAKMFPVIKPRWDDIKKALSITWLGHATCYVTMSRGLKVLTDPVFSERASPVQFAGPARYVRVPCEVKEIPTPHFILISHDHYDHLDEAAIRAIERTSINDAIKPTYFFGLGLKQWFKDTFSDLIPNDRLVELDWWQRHESSLGSVEFVPAQHWGKRGLFDTNTHLWGGFIVKDQDGRTFFFAGDTGYDQELFEELASRHAPVDISAIPIGAYEPRELMRPQHINPEEAHQIHRLIQSKLSLGIHWGTFILTDEPLLEPKHRIIKACEENPDLPPFITLSHGERVEL